MGAPCISGPPAAGHAPTAPGERAQVLRKAVALAERHLAAGALLGGAPLGRCRSFLPLGGHVCTGLSARGHVADDAPGGELPRLVGPAPAGAGAHAARAQ